jgi:hypothetical protein
MNRNFETIEIGTIDFSDLAEFISKCGLAGCDPRIVGLYASSVVRTVNRNILLWKPEVQHTGTEMLALTKKEGLVNWGLVSLLSIAYFRPDLPEHWHPILALGEELVQNGQVASLCLKRERTICLGNVDGLWGESCWYVVSEKAHG